MDDLDYTTTSDKNKALTTTDLQAINVISTYTKKYGTAYPSYETIATGLNVSRRWAIQVLNKLVSLGIVLKTIRPERGPNLKQKTNIYQLSPDWAGDHASDTSLNSATAATSPEESLQSLNTKADDIIIHPDQYQIFMREARIYRVPMKIVKSMFKVLYKSLMLYPAEAVRIAARKAFARWNIPACISHLPAWFATVLDNEEDKYWARELEKNEVLSWERWCLLSERMGKRT